MPASQRDVFAKVLAEYIAVQTYNADRPEGRMNLGNLYVQRHDVGGAIDEYRKAIAIDPTFAAAYANLADLYRAGGVEAEAEKTLREGIARNPREAVLHHALGLTLVRQKRQRGRRCRNCAPPRSSRRRADGMPMSTRWR